MAQQLTLYEPSKSSCATQNINRCLIWLSFVNIIFLQYKLTQAFSMSLIFTVLPELGNLKAQL